MDALQDEIRSNSTLNDLKQLKTIIIDCTKSIKSNDATFNISTMPAVSEKLTGFMNDYVESFKKIESYQKAFIKVKEEIDKLDEDCDDQNIESFGEYVECDTYNKMFEEIAEKHYNNSNTKEKDALLELEEIIRPPEEEIQIQAPTRQIPKDPMTKKDIRNAIKSTVCHHVYDKDGIEEYFRLREQANRANRIQCPQAGCLNKNMSRSELVPDEETNRLIQSLSR